jgi:hypothetical protein
VVFAPRTAGKVTGVTPSLHELPPAEKLRRRLAWLPQRRAQPQRPSVSPVVVEEEAANLLYGDRTGTVNASPLVPPLGGEEPGED